MTQINNIEYYQQLNDKYRPIEIKCRGADMLPLEAIADFQGKLKKRSQDSKRRLALSMFSKGFIAPFFVWEKDGTCKILDGHARDEVLREIRAAGISVPDLFPVDYIDAENEQDAREKLLSITSQYGEFDKEELALWLDDLDNEIKESLRIVDEEITIVEEEGSKTDDHGLRHLSFLVDDEQYLIIHDYLKGIKENNELKKYGDALFLVIQNAPDAG
jgi:hypothetical protein